MCESSFSAVNHIKSKTRSRLDSQMLSACTCIRLALTETQSATDPWGERRWGDRSPQEGHKYFWNVSENKSSDRKLLQICCCGLIWWANAGSTTLSAYIRMVAEHRLVKCRSASRSYGLDTRAETVDRREPTEANTTRQMSTVIAESCVLWERTLTTDI